MSKNAFGVISILLTLTATVPYLINVVRGTTKPHLFTWLIWSLTMGIAAFARDAGDAGPGAWSSYASALACMVVALLALIRGEKQITKTDAIALMSACLIVPIWRATENPLLAVVAVTLIDVLGYYPTFRKSYRKPSEEMVFNYLTSNFVHVMSLAASITYSWTTVLMPAVLFCVNSGLISMILWRRRILKKSQNSSS